MSGVRSHLERQDGEAKVDGEVGGVLPLVSRRVLEANDGWSDDSEVSVTCQNNGARVSYGLYAGEREGRAHEKNEGESEQSEVMAK